MNCHSHSILSASPSGLLQSERGLCPAAVCAYQPTKTTSTRSYLRTEHKEGREKRVWGVALRAEKQEWVGSKKREIRAFQDWEVYHMKGTRHFPSYHLIGLQSQLNLVVPKLLALPIGILDLLEKPQFFLRRQSPCIADILRGQLIDLWLEVWNKFTIKYINTDTPQCPPLRETEQL